MDKQRREQLLRLLAGLENGKLDQQAFSREASALIGLEPTALEPKRFRRTRVLFRVDRVDIDSGNRIEGYVFPGAAPFSQRFSEGVWDQTIISGRAVIDVDGERVEQGPGDRLQIKPGKSFTFLNETRSPWRFKASHDAWRTATAFYRFKGEEVDGSTVWFALRPTPRNRGPIGAAFRLLPAGGGFGRAADGGFATDCVAQVNQSTQTMNQASTAGADVVTVLQGQVTVGGGSDATDLKGAGQTVVKSPEPFSLYNPGPGHSFVLIQPDPPRVWEPETALYELEPGHLATGDQVWFELLFPR